MGRLGGRHATVGLEIMAVDELRFDVFLSYNSADRAAVERVAERLRSERIEAWWDRWNLTPGGSWQAEIVEGLQASKACAVIVGPAGLGDWAREEMALALDRAAKEWGFRLFMVLLPGAPDLSDASLAFVRMRTWVDLRQGLSDRDGIADLIAAITGIPRRREVTAAAPGTCPYRGLEAFEEDHAELFFGRGNEVALAIEKLRASRFLAVLGPSGSGKSSLVRAGIVPALRRGALSASESFTIRVFTPGARPLTAMAVQLGRLYPGAAMQQTLDQLHDDQRSLDLAVSLGLAERPAHERVVLVVDQFEELFTLCGDEDERRAFLANLTYAAAIPGGRIAVIVGLRADFYHRCAPYPDLRALVGDQQLLVGPIDADGLRQAIEEPATRVGLELEAGLAETILDDVIDRPGALPLLEHVLLELWQRRRGTMLTLEAYVASGGVEGALQRRADAIYSSFTEHQRRLARRVLLRLVQPGEGAEDTRRRAEMDELVARPGDRADVEAVVQALADQRLLTVGRDDLSAKAVVEITHEALIRGWPELRAWVNEDREALRTQRRLTEAAGEWDRSGQHDDGLLYRGARLAGWQERSLDDVAEVERRFLQASRDRQAREQAASRRRVRGAVGAVLIAVTTVAVVALVLLRQVSDQKDVALSRQLAAQATAQLQVNDSEALDLAIRAVQQRPTNEAQLALRQAVESSPLRAMLNDPKQSVGSAAFSPDGTRVVSAGTGGTVKVWEWASPAEPTVLRHGEGGVNSVAFSPDGTRVVSAGGNGTVKVWEWASPAEPTVLHHGVLENVSDLRDDSTFEAEGDVDSAAFSPDGTLVVSAGGGGGDGTVKVWEWASRAEPTVLHHGELGVNSVAFSPDGTRVVSGGGGGGVGGGTVKVWPCRACGPIGEVLATARALGQINRRPG